MTYALPINLDSINNVILKSEKMYLLFYYKKNILKNEGHDVYIVW